LATTTPSAAPIWGHLGWWAYLRWSSCSSYCI